MNCKPGDLAVIVRSYSSEYVGRIVTVVRLYAGRAYPGSGWIVDYKGEEWHALDADLRPIRDPGEDAECESKAWLPPVPNSTKETV